ncbi:hypothetical protein D3C87_1635370 [compost metagenome]
MITNRELAALFTPLGSSLIAPNNLSSRLLAANRLRDPPLCSKNAQKMMEKIMNTSAAPSFFASAAVWRVIS